MSSLRAYKGRASFSPPGPPWVVPGLNVMISVLPSQKTTNANTENRNSKALRAPRRRIKMSQRRRRNESCGMVCYYTGVLVAELEKEEEGLRSAFPFRGGLVEQFLFIFGPEKL